MAEDDVFGDIPEMDETANEDTRLVTVNFRLGSEEGEPDPKSDPLKSESSDIEENKVDGVPLQDLKVEVAEDETKTNETKA